MSTTTPHWTQAEGATITNIGDWTEEKVQEHADRGENGFIWMVGKNPWFKGLDQVTTKAPCRWVKRGPREVSLVSEAIMQVTKHIGLKHPLWFCGSIGDQEFRVKQKQRIPHPLTPKDSILVHVVEGQVVEVTL